MIIYYNKINVVENNVRVKFDSSLKNDIFNVRYESKIIMLISLGYYLLPYKLQV